MQDAAKQAIGFTERHPRMVNDLYNDIRAYAIEQGMDEATVNTIVDPTAIKILHKQDCSTKQSRLRPEESRCQKKVLRSTKEPR